jgi:hypothetical protein
MNKIRISLYILSALTYIGCFGLFVYLMKDIWLKYNMKITTIGIRNRIYNEQEKLLPCFTIHSFTAFKKRGFYFTDDLIKANSITAEEMFDQRTIAKFKTNTTFYSMEEYYSIYYGTCFTLCYLQKLPPKQTVRYIQWKSLNVITVGLR